jgi:hypothetical protein
MIIHRLLHFTLPRSFALLNSRETGVPRSSPILSTSMLMVSSHPTAKTPAGFRKWARCPVHVPYPFFPKILDRTRLMTFKTARIYVGYGTALPDCGRGGLLLQAAFAGQRTGPHNVGSG